MVTVAVCPASALNGLNPMVAAGSTVSTDEFKDSNAAPPVVFPDIETAYWVGEETLTDVGIVK